MQNYNNDNRIVLSLDAGGQNLDFCAIQNNKITGKIVNLPSESNNLEKCLNNIVNGFKAVKEQLNQVPSAISFAFPGPTDYAKGIVGKQKNLPAFTGGVALKSLLENEFNIPVFLNNDGDLFTYGEAIAGFLPKVNAILREAGNEKQYKNLLGVTIGTGFGAGIVINGNLLLGDNSTGAEIWCMRNKKYPNSFAEESVSTRGIIRVYKSYVQKTVPEHILPKDIYEIALGQRMGDKAAALKSFEEMGEVLGDALANAVALVDGLIVIGGGISRASNLFFPSMMKELTGKIQTLQGTDNNRIDLKVFDLENQTAREAFCKSERTKIQIPFSTKTITYDPTKRIGIGLATMDTAIAVAIGAYHFALAELDSSRNKLT